MFTKTAGEPRSAETQQKFHFIHGAIYGSYLCVLPQFTSSITYMVSCRGMTFASFHISQVPMHTWCHVWKLHVRLSVFHNFHIIYGTIHGTMYGTTSRYNSHIWHQVSHVWHHITHTCTPYKFVTFLQGKRQ